MQTRLQLHYITQHCTTLITLQYTTAATTATLHYTTLHYNYNYSTFHQYTTLHYTMHYTKYTTPQLQLQLQLHYTNYTTLQLQLTTTTPLHYNYTYNCTTPHYIPAVVGEVTTATIAATPKTQLQPPFGPSVDLLCHPWFTTTNLSYRFPISETSATTLCGTTGKN